MLMECLIDREGPTEVNIAGFKYRFEDDGHGARVADVNSEEHRDHLIASGFYRIFDETVRREVAASKEKQERRQEETRDNPKSNTSSAADIIGLATREFMPLTKDKFKEWMIENASKVAEMPVEARNVAVAKWDRMFPGERCPVTKAT